MAETRQRMIDAAVRLLAVRGLQETSFSAVVEASGAPRGSLYHHFPDGKDQLIAAAVDRAGEGALAVLNATDGSSAAAVTDRFLDLWRDLLTRSHFRAGCSVAAVTVATDSPELIAHTAEVFRSWRRRLAEILEVGGLGRPAAEQFAAALVAGAEGAVVLARAEQRIEPFDLVAAHLREHVRTLAAAGR